MNVLDYYTQDQSARIFAAVSEFQTNKIETPYILINTDIIQRQYLKMKQLYTDVKIYYAVKANPSNQIIRLLDDLGSNFDIASRYQLDQVLNLGISADRVSYGNTIKKVRDIQYFYKKGVRLFATDSLSDIQNISKVAIGSKVFCRILPEQCEQADWPLSKKFGCSINMAIQILKYAKQHGLVPYGISFHVGSQQRNINSWKVMLQKVKYIFDTLKQFDIQLKMINLGGGLPANYIQKTESTETYFKYIKEYISTLFSEDVQIIMQPGRSLVGNSGVIISQVINITQKHFGVNQPKWLYTDASLFNGLIQTIGQSIKYPIICIGKQNEQQLQQYIIAGPTCDSMDILYQKQKIKLPVNIKSGDKLLWITAGAYTASYAAVCFNGFPPIKTYFI